MSYQVLARKWRPRTFREMVGQEHVLQALINALDRNRLHHAYLFTGTRGVGKTTIARILAKCLNCETGVSSEPCGTCTACMEINEGRFVDLIEVDAASRTKVEDTRELLENVQYAPTRGRFKVYLIDEVHMLSSHSFNALLKTLEEPPPHVKFLLATTDPQKLPITILSRCLQFNLKNMSPERIVEHLQFILDKEMVPFELSALWHLGRAADGSMRDAMSLTDQAIAFGGGKVAETEVTTMLGTIDQGLVYELLTALATLNGEQMLAAVALLAEHAPDYNAALAELLTVLHRIAIAQALPEAVDNSFGDRTQVLELAQQIPAEDVQLFYQTALLGRRDLHLSPDPRGGFEMVLLRMLAFKPQGVPEVPASRLPGGQVKKTAAGQMDSPSVGVESAGGTSPEKKPEQRLALTDNPLGENTAGAATAVATGQNDSVNPQRMSVSEPAMSTAAVEPAVQEAVNQVTEVQAAQVQETETQETTAQEAVVQETVVQGAIVQSTIVQSTNVQSTNVNSPVVQAAAAQETAAPETVSHETAVSETPGAAVAEMSMPDTVGSKAAVSAKGSDIMTGQSVSGKNAETVQALSASDSAPAVSIDRQPANAEQSVTERELPGSGSVEKAAAPTATEKSTKIALEEMAPELWTQLYIQLGVGGVLQSTAANCLLVGRQGTAFHFLLDENHSTLYDEAHDRRLADMLSDYFDEQVQVYIQMSTIEGETPAAWLIRKREERQQQAVRSIETDTHVEQLMTRFQAVLQEGSVEPID